jgi:hypothetical protein
LILYSVVYRDVTRQAKGLYRLKHVGALRNGLAYLSRYNSGWFCHTGSAGGGPASTTGTAAGASVIAAGPAASSWGAASGRSGVAASCSGPLGPEASGAGPAGGPTGVEAEDSGAGWEPVPLVGAAPKDALGTSEVWGLPYHQYG